MVYGLGLAHGPGKTRPFPMGQAPVHGDTLLTGTVGDPIGHVRAPEVMAAWLARRGINAMWLPFHVSPENLGAFVAGMRALGNVAGFTVTMPHKEKVIPLLDHVTDIVERTGSANLVRREADGRLIGDNVDGVGFMEGLRVSGVSVTGRSVWLVGLGGAGAAIAWALAGAKPGRMILHDINETRAVNLADSLRQCHGDIAIEVARPESIDVAINATPLGLHAEDDLPFDPGVVKTGGDLVEIIMTPEVTPLMAKAADQGLHVVPGRRMLDGQLQRYADFMGLSPATG